MEVKKFDQMTDDKGLTVKCTSCTTGPSLVLVGSRVVIVQSLGVLRARFAE